MSPIEDPVTKVLQVRANHFSDLVAWSTAIVVVGVALEAIEIIHDVVAWKKRKYREQRERTELEEVAQIFPCGETRGETASHSDHPRWVKRWLRVGLITVVIGVIGEWRCGAKLEDAHNAIHEYDLAKLAAAEQEAASAKESAGAAYERAAKTEQEAAEDLKATNIARQKAERRALTSQTGKPRGW